MSISRQITTCALASVDTLPLVAALAHQSRYFKIIINLQMIWTSPLAGTICR